MGRQVDKKLKILFLGSWGTDGGAGIAMTRLEQGLSQLGHSVTIISLDSLQLPRYAGVTSLLARVNRKYEFSILGPTGLIDGLYKSVNWLPLNPIFWLKVRQFDLVHIHWINTGFLGLNHVNRIARKKPTVWTLHSFWPFSGPHHHFRELNSAICKPYSFIVENELRLLQKVSKQISLWILPSNFMKVQLPSLGFRVIPNVIPAPTSGRVSEVRNNSLVYACAGDVFDPRKGLVDLLREWVSLPELHDNYQLEVVGPLWEHSKPTHLFEEAQKKNVKFYGKMSESELSSHFDKSFATIVPSQEETFGLVIGESLAAGTPVLARKSLGSLNDFQTREKGVYPIEIEANQIVKSLNAIKGSRLNRGKLSAEILVLFGADSVAQKHLQVYSSLLC